MIGRLRGLSLAFTLALGPLAFADRIELKNGRSIEGIINRETDTNVVLQVGAGSLTLPRTNILSIEYGSATEQWGLWEAWRDKYLLYKPYVPAACRDLASRFRLLERRHDEAIGARRELAHSESDRRRLQAEIDARQADFLEINRRLSQATPEQDIAAYNELVGLNNTILSERALKMAALDDLNASRSTRFKTIGDYVQALQEARSAVEDWKTARRDDPPIPDDERRYVDALDRRLNAYDAQFQRIEVPVRTEGHTSLVSVVLNDRAAGTFILDTGASVVSVSRDFARQAGVDFSKASTTRAILADGRPIDALAVTLDSVRVGQATAQDVAAIVISTPPDQKVDGLLGMSFLHRFIVRFDGATGQLILESFSPN